MSCTPFRIEDISARFETGHGLPPDTRVVIYMCNVTHFARAILQIQQESRWQNSGLAGIGNGRADAVADLHLQLAQISRATDAIKYAQTRRTA